MGTDVQNIRSLSVMSQPNNSQSSQSPSASVQNSTQEIISSRNNKKKTKKAMTYPSSSSPQPGNLIHSPSHTGSVNSGSDSTTEPSPSHSVVQTDSDTTEQWQQRVQSLRKALNKTQKENQLLLSDLTAAMARANDAENAEDAVNKGLLTARSVILQRDRTISELKSTCANLRADLTQLQEEKKKTDKRLVLLKTVSANLQEAREARDSTEKKLEHADSEISALRKQHTSVWKDKESLKQQVETMEMVKQQLARREIELDGMSRELAHARKKARQGEMRGLAFGALSMLAVKVISQLVGKSHAGER